MVCAEGGDAEQVEAYWTPVGVPGQSGVVCVGRICNEVSTSTYFVSGFVLNECLVLSPYVKHNILTCLQPTTSHK